MLPHDLAVRLADYMDLITSVVCYIGSFTCIYLMQVILRERAKLVQLQRLCLAGLAAALFFNGSTWYPEWALVAGHRPTGVVVDITIAINLVVMAARGHMIYQAGLEKEKSDAVGSE